MIPAPVDPPADAVPPPASSRAAGWSVPRLLRRSFRARIVVTVIAVVLATQLASFLAVHTLMTGHEQTMARERSERAAVTVDRLLGAERSRLLQAAAALGADAGFRAAAAARDDAAVASALSRRLGGVGTDVAALVFAQGDRVAARAGGPAAALAALTRARTDAGELLATVVHEGRIYLLATLPLDGWLPGARVLVGSVVAEPAVRALARASGVEIGLLARSEGVETLVASREDLPRPDRLRDGAPAGLRFDVDRFHTDVHPLPAAGGTVQLLLHRSVAGAPRPYRQLRLALALIAGLAVLAALVAGLVLARRVSASLLPLAAAMRRIGRGDYGRRPEVAGDDELAALARRVERMQGSIAEREARMLHQAAHDPVTGLLHGPMARARLARSLADARAGGEPVAVMVLGVARFDGLAGALGPQAAARVLRELARRIDGAGRRADLVARHDGDTVVVLAPESTSEGARALARRLIARASAPVQLDGVEIGLDLNVGIAGCPEHAEDLDTLVHHASAALRAAGGSGVPVQVHAPSGSDGSARRSAIVSAMARTLGQGDVNVHYQAILEPSAPGTLLAEALLRWTDALHGPLPAAEIVDLAQRSGHARRLTDHVLASAAAQQRRWRDQGLAVTVSVNLSVLDVLDEALPDRLSRILADSGVTASGITLEIPAGAVLAHAARCADVLPALRARGHRIAVDGVGTCSPPMLARLPVHEVKLDRALVARLAPGGVDEAVARSVVDLAHHLGLVVTAVGVETQAARHLLAAIGCDRIQGFLVARPAAAADMTRWFEARRPVLARTG